MNKIEINIGLNNNPVTAKILTLFVNASFVGRRSAKTEIQIGEWEGADEPTLVVEVFSTESQFVIKELVETLVEVCTQDAIAFRFNGDGELVFNDNYTGERYPFDENYFLTIK